MPPGPWEPPADAVPHLTRMRNWVIETWHWYSDLGLSWLLRVVMKTEFKSEAQAGVQDFRQAWTIPWAARLRLMTREDRERILQGRMPRSNQGLMFSVDKGAPERGYEVMLVAFAEGDHVWLCGYFSPVDPIVTPWKAFVFQSAIPMTELEPYRHRFVKDHPEHSESFERLDRLCRLN